MSKREVHKLNIIWELYNEDFPYEYYKPNLSSYLKSERIVGYTFRIPKDVAILFLVILQKCAYTPVWLYFFSGYTS